MIIYKEKFRFSYANIRIVIDIIIHTNCDRWKTAYFVNNTIRRMAEELREFEQNEITPILVRRKSRINAFFRETSYIGKLLDLFILDRIQIIR